MTTVQPTEHSSRSHADFVACESLTREPESELGQVDRACLNCYINHPGTREFDYSLAEHQRLRTISITMCANPRFLENFDRTYNFIYWMTTKIREGSTNSIGGICYSIAISNYAEMAQEIERYTTQIELAGELWDEVPPL